MTTGVFASMQCWTDLNVEPTQSWRPTLRFQPTHLEHKSKETCLSFLRSSPRFASIKLLQPFANGPQPCLFLATNWSRFRNRDWNRPACGNLTRGSRGTKFQKMAVSGSKLMPHRHGSTSKKNSQPIETSRKHDSIWGGNDLV